VSPLLAAAPAVFMLLLNVPAGAGAMRLPLGRAPRPGLPLMRDRTQVVSDFGGCLMGLALGVVGAWPATPVAPWWLAATATALVAVVGVLRWRVLLGVAPDGRGRRRPRARTASAAVSVVVGVAAAVAASGAFTG